MGLEERCSLHLGFAFPPHGHTMLFCLCLQSTYCFVARCDNFVFPYPTAHLLHILLTTACSRMHQACSASFPWLDDGGSPISLSPAHPKGTAWDSASDPYSLDQSTRHACRSQSKLFHLTSLKGISDFRLVCPHLILLGLSFVQGCLSSKHLCHLGIKMSRNRAIHFAGRSCMYRKA